MEKMLRSLSPKSETAEAIRYALARWCALTRYVDDGRIEIDNSAAERALRAVALGRKKSFLWFGWRRRERGGHSLLGTAKLNGVDPELWLREVFTRIAERFPSVGSRTCCPGISPPISSPALVNSSWEFISKCALNKQVDTSESHPT
jgi:hypothetical protein